MICSNVKPSEETATYADGSIIYGMGADGKLHHIDDVERGESCDCTCPDPHCGQPLVAKKGSIKAHHFAHKRGTCKWAVEYVISSIAAQIIAARGCMVFPALTYYDSMKNRSVVIADSQRVGISSVELVEESGRGNPDLLITRNVAGTERQFLVVISLTHPLNTEQLEKIQATGHDAFLVNLKRIYDWRRSENKHFDREALPLEFQSARFLKSILVNGNGRCMQWLANAKQEAKEAESEREYDAWRKREEQLRREAERRRAEERKREFEKRRKREEEQKREAEKRRKERARKRAQQEAEEARAAEEAARLLEAELAADRKRVIAELDQQDEQVRDSFGNRWIRCEKCGKASTVDDFQSYGGAGRINLGICYDCARRQAD